MSDSPSEPSLLSVQVHGDHDNDVTVVLGAALGATPAMWTPLLPYLADLRVVLYGLRGHGGSAAPATDYTLEQLSDDVLGAMDQLSIGSAHQVGTSLGGLIALDLAARHPDRVESVVAICSTAHPGNADDLRARAVAVRDQGMLAVHDRVARWFTPEFLEDPAARAVAQDLLTVDPCGYAGCCAALAAADLRPRLADISARTLVIAAEHDEVLPVEHSRALADALPQATLQVVAGGAHLVPAQQPRAVADLLRAHLGLAPID